jgi:hypothetical protein
LHPVVTTDEYIAEKCGSNRNASDIHVGCATVKFLWANFRTSRQCIADNRTLNFTLYH